MTRKIGLILFGIALLAAAELGLSVSARLMLFVRGRAARVAAGSGTTVIACLGDSHTYGVGTSFRYSYPEQLNELLKRNNPQGKFLVINLGVPGDTTRGQAERLDDFLRRRRADLVIMLTGRNNDADIESLKNGGPADTMRRALRRIRLFKIMSYAATRLLRGPRRQRPPPADGDAQTYTRYMNCHLDRVRRLARRHGSRLLFISYYNESDRVVAEFCRARHLPYADIAAEFQPPERSEDAAGLLSSDGSHLNHRGYARFARLVYTELFLFQRRLGLTLAPCLQTPSSADFYPSPGSAAEALATQQARIARSNNDPFEIVNLGHIYIELKQDEAARACFIEGLRASGYSDNNALVAPILTWYLERGMHAQARAVCNEILEHNPANTLARAYAGYIATLDDEMGNKGNTTEGK